MVIDIKNDIKVEEMSDKELELFFNKNNKYIESLAHINYVLKNELLKRKYDKELFLFLDLDFNSITKELKILKIEYINSISFNDFKNKYNISNDGFEDLINSGYIVGSAGYIIYPKSESLYNGWLRELGPNIKEIVRKYNISKL